MTGFELREAPTWPAQAPAGPIPPDDSWSPLERWIWEKLQAGAIANIDEYADDSGRMPPADPKKPEDWQDGRRRLAPRFLDDLLLREPHRSGLHRKGVRIKGAWLDDEIDLSMAELARTLGLVRCRFEKAADLKYLRTPAPVSLDCSAFAAQLDLQGACIDASLFMRDGAEFNEVVLNGAKVGGQVSLIGARVNGTLAMDSADIGQTLLMRSDREVSEHRAEFNNVVLRGAKVGGQVDLCGAKVNGTLNMDSADIGQSLLMEGRSEQRAEFNDVALNSAKVRGSVSLIGAKVAGTLDMDSADIGQHLFMRSESHQRAEFNDVVLNSVKVGGSVSLIGAKVAGKLKMASADIGQNLLMESRSEQRAEFNDVVLNSAKVGGSVSLIGAKVAGTLNTDSADIGQHLFMRSESQQRAEFDGDVRLIVAEVGGNIDVSGAVLSSLDLSGTRIGGELRIASGSGSPRWKDGGKLVLRNASVDAIQDTDEKGAWPPVLDLDGFTYRRLGGLGADAEAGVAKRGSRWFIDWLARDEPHTPQPLPAVRTGAA